MKKILFSGAILIAAAFWMTGCGNDTSNRQMTGNTEETDITQTETQDMQETPGLEGISSEDELTFPIGQEIRSASFSGTAYLSSMITNDDVYHFPQTNHVTFEPGARSSWHSHGGMLILVTGGVGYYQEEGKPAQIIRKGDVVECMPGVRHWHGAAPDSWFSQMVIYDSYYIPEEGEVVQEEPVTDEYYANLETEEYQERTAASEDQPFMFPKAERALTSDTFSGPAYVSTIIGDNNAAGAPGLHYVVFDAGVINNWHIHEGGQILIATDGIGYHQMEGEPVQVLYPGDVALCPPGVKHWHGGSVDTEFAHIAVNTNPELTGLQWFDRISEEEYINLLRRDSGQAESGMGYVTEGTETYRDFLMDNIFHSEEEGDIHYHVYIPESYDGSRPYALFFTLPGYEGLYFQGAGANLQAEEFGFEAGNYNSEMIIVAPQLNDWGETSADQTIALLEYFLEEYNIDRDKVYGNGYSGGGETMSIVMGKRPDLFTAYLHVSSWWDGAYEPVAKQRLPVYFVIGRNDEYYGSEPTWEAYDTLHALYENQGLLDDEIDKLLVLDIKEHDYFTIRNVSNEHGGGLLTAYDETIMGWLFSDERNPAKQDKG